MRSEDHIWVIDFSGIGEDRPEKGSANFIEFSVGLQFGLVKHSADKPFCDDFQNKKFIPNSEQLIHR